MAVETLYLKVFDDNSDVIVKTDRFHPTEQEIIDYLPGANLLLQIAPVAKIGGILVDGVENVNGVLYNNLEDEDGEWQTDKKLIIIRPGQELVIWSELSDREIWFVFEPYEQRADASIPRIETGV